MAYVCLGDLTPMEFYDKFETEKPRDGVEIESNINVPKKGEDQYRHF